MSDSPRPPGQPPPGQRPPPPPPPPDLSPPPGYQPYAGQPASIQRLKRVGGLVKALVILTAIAGAASLVAALVQGLARDDAEAFLAGEITEDEFVEAFLPSAGLGLLTAAVQVAVVVLTMIVMFRMAGNLRSLGRRTTWAPGWAIGGWFLPPFVLYVIPFLMFRELWKASDPEIPPGDDSWKNSSVSPAVSAWWVLYGLAPLALLVVQGANAVGGGFATGDTEALAEMLTEQYALTVVSGALTLAAAIAYIMLIRGLGSRHRRLTAESSSS